MARLEIVLFIAEDKVRGWQSVTINRSMESVGHTWSIQYQTEAETSELSKFPFEMGAPVRIEANGQTVLDGYIEDREVNLEASNYSITLGGRSKTAQIADSAAYFENGAWSGRDVLQICEDLTSDYDIEVEIGLGVDLGETFKKFKINSGETVFAAMDRAAKERGLMLIPDEGGTLALDRATSLPPVGDLKSLGTIISRSSTAKFGQRYRYYLGRSKHPGKGSIFDGELPAGVHRSIDEGVPLHRIKILSGHGKNAELKKQVEWHRNVMAGRSKRFNIQMDGWFDKLQRLWVPNTMVHLTDKTLFVDSDLIIASVQYRLTVQDGDTATLQLAPREAFDLIQPTPRLPKKGGPPKGFTEVIVEGEVKGAAKSAAKGFNRFVLAALANKDEGKW